MNASDAITEDDLIDIVTATGEEFNVGRIQVKHMHDPTRMAEVIRIFTRHNDSKYGSEISITQEMLMDGYEDILMQQIEQTLRGLDEKIIEEESITYEYRGRPITCAVDAPYAKSRCEECYYVHEFGELPTMAVEAHGNVKTQSVIERWRRERLWIYMLEKTDRNCPCGMHRRRNNRKI